MKGLKEIVEGKDKQIFHLRKLTKSGSSRYLSVGTILPSNWLAVKVFVIVKGENVFVLRLEQIK